MSCVHADRELIYEDHDGWPMLVSVLCEDCNTELIETYSLKEREEMNRDELSYRIDSAFDSLRDMELERMREEANGESL